MTMHEAFGSLRRGSEREAALASFHGLLTPEDQRYMQRRAEIKKWILGLFDGAFAGELDGWQRGNILKDGRDALLLGGIKRAETWAAKFSDKTFAVSG